MRIMHIEVYEFHLIIATMFALYYRVPVSVD